MSNLTQFRLMETLRYSELTGAFTWVNDGYRKIKAGDVAGTLSHGYVVIGLDYGRYLAHRLAWLYVTGSWPVAQIDHIDRNRSNNAWSNLRQATVAQNAHNSATRKDSISSHRGVDWRPDKNKWRSRLHVFGKAHSLGHFNTLEEAVNARAKAEILHYGAFAPKK